MDETERDSMVSVTASPAITPTHHRLDNKRKQRVNALAQLMDIPSATVVQIAIDRLFQSKTTKEKINNGK